MEMESLKNPNEGDSQPDPNGWYFIRPIVSPSSTFEVCEFAPLDGSPAHYRLVGKLVIATDEAEVKMQLPPELLDATTPTEAVAAAQAWIEENRPMLEAQMREQIEAAKRQHIQKFGRTPGGILAPNGNQNPPNGMRPIR